MSKVFFDYSIRVGLFISLILISSIDLHSQTYPFQHYSTADGLAHSSVRRVFQDSRGVLWFGTRGGVSRYDANEFVAYLARDSLKSDVFDIWEDEDGVLWFATYGNGLAKKSLDDTTFLWTRASDEALPSDVLTGIYKDVDNNIWISSGDGLALWKADGTTVIYDRELGQHHGEVYSFVRDQGGTLWIGTHSGLLVGRLEADNRLTLKKTLDKPIRSLLLLRNGEVLAGTSGGGNDRYGVVCRFHNGMADTLLSYQTTHHLIKAQALFEDRKGRIWIGTESGVYIVQDGKITHLRRENGLFNENLRDITEDKEGTLWFATDNGVMKLVPPVFVNFGVKEGMSGYEVLCMLHDRRQNLWLGTWNGVNRLQPDGQIRYWDETNGLCHHTISSLAEDGDGSIWIGTELGLNVLSREGITTQNVSGFPAHSQIWSLCRDPDAGMWVAAKGLIAKLMHGRTCLLLGSSEGVPNDVIAPLFVDDERRLWFGTGAHGAGIYQNDRITFVNRENGLPDNNVFCFYPLAPDEIWIGTGRGLARWKAGRLEKVPFAAAELAKGAVYFIFRDRLQHVWFGTEYGLYEWTGSVVHHYTTRDGLASDIVTQCTMLEDGSLWFGTRDGVSYLSPSDRSLPVPVPLVHLDGVFAGEKDRPLVEPAVVGYNDRSIVFSFNAVSFVDEKALVFQWRLQGFDKGWIGPHHQRRVRYTNLSPGKYSFHVRAANRNGEWSVPAQFAFVIRPPYWQTWWFIMLIALLLAAVIFLFHRYRLNQLRKIERMRSRIAADLHDDIASSLASVSLYSEVIQRQVSPGSDEVRSLLNRIRDLAQEVMENIGTIVWAVDPRRDELSELLRYFQRYARQLCTAAGVNFASQLPEHHKSIILTPEQRRTIYLIFKEGLANVLHHAHCTQVVFSCTFQNHLLEMSLQDNGQGFDPNVIRDGHGMTNISMRAQTIGAKMAINSQPGQGAEIRLRLRMT